jgi:hypothetical protein
MDSANTQPPGFGQTWPLNPQLDQLVRVTGGAVSGPTIDGNPLYVYPGVLLQFDPATLTSRNRVACWVTEPNNVPLGPSIYDTRLVGAWPPNAPPATQQPLFAASCCVVGGSFASSSSSLQSSSSSLSSSVGISRVPLGTGTATATAGTATVTMAVTVPAGALLMVLTSNGELGGSESTTVTFGGTPMALNFASPLISTGGVGGIRTRVRSLPVGTTTTANIVVSTTLSNSGFVLVIALYVVAMQNNAADVQSTGSGAASAPDSGKTSPTAVANEYAQGAFTEVGGSTSWLAPFVGGQTVSLLFNGVTFVLCDGYQILNSIGTVEAQMTATATAWTGGVQTFD